jgi:hypothetical protein
VIGPTKEWGIQDCINVHKLLDTVFAEQGVANSKFQYAIPNLFIAPYIHDSCFLSAAFVMFANAYLSLRAVVKYPALTNVM